ncbi:integrase [Baekduia alba]|uniref:tyrosine-type recombinase/integrase n=1 Tax=Baekduia alba TaxID=2997333 RepID=UPI002340A89A|nr:tyrosine-type recombinase/integrase [Baekduia alba]WCB95505.1 integrase [Baekduia alba]
MSTTKPTRARSATGIYVKHRDACASHHGGACTCRPAYQAAVWSARERRRIRRHFDSFGDAKAWRAEQLVGLRKGTVKAPTRTTLAEAAAEWLAGADAGTILARNRQPYKPSALRGYRRALEQRVVPELGHYKLSAIDHVMLQDFADRLARTLDASTVRNTLSPVQAIMRRAVKRGVIAINPAVGLELQAPQGRRDRVASPAEAAALLSALAEGDRALWATALYAGLRRGELRALRWDDVDLEANVIRVARSWDDVAGPIEPKSRAGVRTVPIASALRALLVEHRLRRGGHGEDLVFGHVDERSFEPSSVRRRALTAWKRAKLLSIGLHECRHTFASLMIAAGVNAKALSTYMGHSSVTITFDRYGHLMPGNEEQAAGLLDDYLAAASG